MLKDKYIQEEFWSLKNKDKQKLKENERKVLVAIKILLSDPDAIEIFNKKAIYLYIR